MPAILLHGFEHTPNHCQQQQRKQKKRARHHCANNHSPRHSQLPGRLILACQAVFAQLLVHTLHDAYNQLLLIASVFPAGLIVYETLVKQSYLLITFFGQLIIGSRRPFIIRTHVLRQGQDPVHLDLELITTGGRRVISLQPDSSNKGSPQAAGARVKSAVSSWDRHHAHG